MQASIEQHLKYILITDDDVKSLREVRILVSGADEPAMQRLCTSTWKGNIRELQNTIERAMILGTEPFICEADLVPASQSTTSFSAGSKKLKEALGLFEQAHIRHVLNLCKDDKRKAAKDLGISLSSLYRYLGHSAVNSKNKV